MCAAKLPFDFSQAKGPRRGPDVGKDVTGEFASARGAAPAGMTVTSLLALIKGALTESLPPRITVIGEISNLKMHSSGHVYFSLKDAGACINAAMFRQAASRLKFRPADGLEVVVEGRVDVYEVRGQLQLYVEAMIPKGAGALELAFRQLHDKLKAEGLFDPTHKIPLPRFPRAVGVITSPTGAAVRDIRRTLARRWPAATVYLLPVLVQGDGAAQDIAAAIAAMDAAASQFDIDTIIVGRGGGSLEDLWAFNEEAVARAIFACRTPIISGVGHEVDTTIADLVADVRAATPTGAAELAVPDAADVRRQLAQLATGLLRNVTECLRQWRQSLDACMRSVVFRDPRHRLRTQVQHIDELSHRLRAGARQRLSLGSRRLEPAANRLMALHPARLREMAARRLDALVNRLRWVLGGRSKQAGEALATLQGRLLAAHPRNRLAMASQRLDALGRHLEALGYRSILQRGFSVTRSESGQIVRSVSQVAAGATIQTEVADGNFKSRVTNGNPPEETNTPNGELKSTADVKPEQESKPGPKARPRRIADRDDDNLLFD